MSDEQVVKVRRRRSRTEAEQLAAGYEISGLSRTEFCRKHGLALGTLGRYLKRRRQAAGDAAGASRWLAVEVGGAGSTGGSPAASGLAVVLSGGRRIEIGRPFDTDTLAQLLRVLEQL